MFAAATASWMARFNYRRHEVDRRHRKPSFNPLEITSKLPIRMAPGYDDVRTSGRTVDPFGNLPQDVFKPDVTGLRLID